MHLQVNKLTPLSFCSRSKLVQCVWKNSELGMNLECVHAHTHFTRSECSRSQNVYNLQYIYKLGLNMVFCIV